MGGVAWKVILSFGWSYFFFGFLLGARMCRVVNLAEVLKIEMGVNLRGGDAGVAKHFLYGAQVTGRLQYVSGERVAQQMRMHVAGDALCDAPLLHAQLHHTR